MFSWILLIISILAVAIAVGSGVKTYSWVNHAQAVEGTVVELVQKKRTSKKGRRRVSYAPRIRYAINGEDKVFVSSQSANPPKYKVGDTVKVAANPETGKESIATFGELYGFSMVVTCLGSALALALLILTNGERVLRYIHPNLYG